MSGPGIIDPHSGYWTWLTPDENNIGTSTLVVGVSTADGVASCEVDLEVTNEPPKIRGLGQGADTVLVGVTQITRDLDYIDDCGSSEFSMRALTPGLDGSYRINKFGQITVVPDSADRLLPQPLRFMVELTDAANGKDSGEYALYILPRSLLDVRFGVDSLSFSDTSEIHTIPILLSVSDSVPEIGAFELCMSYPGRATSIVLDTVIQGALFDSCKWDYFTYQSYPGPYCPDCGDSVVRIVGLKRFYSPDRGPRCDNPTGGPVTVASLVFSLPACSDFVSLPVRFFWHHCGDNSIAPQVDTTIFIGAHVFDGYHHGGAIRSISDSATGYPTITGPQRDCLATPPPFKPILPRIDFHNTAFYAVGGDCIDATGDINLNGIGYELADVVMFADYFNVGVAAFGTHQWGSIAASDTNRDGVSLGISDLIYLIRVVIGDSQLRIIPGTENAGKGAK